MPTRFSAAEIDKHVETSELQPRSMGTLEETVPVVYCDVFIAGSGPIASAYARTIYEKHSNATIFMAEIGSQSSPIIGENIKNSIKYQKDIDAFVYVVQGALQSVSIPPGDTHIPNLGGQSWTPTPPFPDPIPTTQQLIFQSRNPNQRPELNLGGAAVTRTVGGMATHWTCACPFPHPEERINNPIPPDEFDSLLQRSFTLLNIHKNEFDHSIRHQFIKQALQVDFLASRDVENLPLAVERRKDNPHFVIWTGSNTVLGPVVDDKSRFRLSPETRVTKLIHRSGTIVGALVRDLKSNSDRLICVKSYIVACGAIGTPPVSYSHRLLDGTSARSLLHSAKLIVLKRDIIDAIQNSRDPDVARRVREHRAKYPKDPLPIPFDDPEPQITIPYTPSHPHHAQIHRDAFSYGDVGPRADSRVVVDLRFFGKQDIREENRVVFGSIGPRGEWLPGDTDIYGMPQATFEVRRSREDLARDQRMMNDMTSVANILGGYLPGSEPQFMTPGLALHITGTTRIGVDSKTSVADPSSKVQDFKNLWVGGNNCIPDSTACNPTLTSIAIAIKGAESVVEYLKAYDP